MTIMRKEAVPESCQDAAEVCTLIEKAGVPVWSSGSCPSACSFLSCLAPCGPAAANAIESLPSRVHRASGKKIWENECGGNHCCLRPPGMQARISPRLGIGHFIWYPQGSLAGRSEESFPELVAFASRTAATSCRLVVVTNISKGCPSELRSEFVQRADRRDDELAPTSSRQKRGSPGGFPCPTIATGAACTSLAAAPARQSAARIEQQFARVASTPQGCYAFSRLC